MVELRTMIDSHSRRLFTLEWNYCYPVLIFSIAVLFNWPLVLHPNYIPMTSLTQVTDFLVAHLPYAQYIHGMWIQFGYPPLWNSVMLSGMPLVADPLAGYGYLPNWLLFIYPQPVSYTVLFIFHLAWTGIGLYKFLQNESIHPAAALFGAIAWMGTPRLIGYLGSGQVSTIFALAWYPWLLIALRYMAITKRPQAGLLSGVILAVIILADIRWGFFAALFGLSYLVNLTLFCRKRGKQLVWSLFLFVTAALVLSAVQTLPLFELILNAKRTELTAADRAIFSLDFVAFIGLIAPKFGVFHELITYLGVSTLCLAFFAVTKKSVYWVVLVTLSMIYALGNNSFLFPWISNLIPGLSWLRVPSRLWFFVALGGAILAAYGYNQLLSICMYTKIRRWFLPLSFALALFSIFLAIGMVRFTSSLPKGLISFALNITVMLAILNVALIRQRHRILFLLLPLLLGDLLWFNASVFRAIPIPAPPAALSWLQQQTGLFRVYSPSYSLPHPHLLQSADGINPLHLYSYTEFMHKASNLDTGAYSVSLPDIYADNQTNRDDRELLASPDLYRLGLLNVKYVVADFSLAGFEQPIQTFGNTRIYLNPLYRERVWLEGEGQITKVTWSPDQITVVVEGPGGKVILSEINYPGWKVLVNGNRSSVESIHGLLRGVTVASGKQEITFRYQPTIFFIGLVVSILGWVSILIFQRSHVKTLLAKIRSVFS